MGLDVDLKIKRFRGVTYVVAERWHIQGVNDWLPEIRIDATDQTKQGSPYS